MTICQVFNRFIYDRSSYCSAATIRKYYDDFKIFSRFLMEFYGYTSENSFDDFAPDVNPFKDFIIYLRGKNLKNVSIRSYARSLKAFFRYAYDEDFAPDYLKKVKLPKDDSAPKVPLCMDEVAKIDSLFDKKTVKGLRNYCIIHLMLDCGLRRQEVINLQVDHVDPQRNIIHIVDSKGNKSRFVLVPDFLLNYLSIYLSMCGHSSGYYLRSLKSSGAMTNETIKQLFQDLKVAADIPRLHAHLLRHTFATSYLIGGGNMEFLRIFLGHYDYSVTQKYTQLAAEMKMLGTDIYKLDSIFFRFGY